MATDKTLALRKIQPHARPAGLPQPNPLRREAKAGAKKAGISVRRWKRQQRKADRASRLDQ